MTKKSVRRLAMLAAAGAMLVAQGAAQAADEPLRLTKPVNATKADLNPQRTYSPPGFAVHPDNPKIIVGGFIEFRARQCGLIRSTDGGETWRILDSNPAINTQPYCQAANSNIFHAPVAWGRDGTLYLATHAWDETTRTQTSIILARSEDMGDNWTTVFARDARTTKDADQENDRPVTGLYVDRESGSEDTVYVLYRRAYTNRTAPNAFPQHPVVAISRDGGRTFEEPVSALGNPYASEQVRQQGLTSRTTATTAPGATTTIPPEGSAAAEPLRVDNFGASSNGQGITADDDGNLYVTYMSEIANVSGAPRAIVVSKSTDQGRTWQGVLARPFSYENAQNPRIAWTPGGGANGTVHVVWEWRHPAELNTYADVGYIRSTDGGQVWSEPRRIADDDPTKLFGKYLPEIKVAPNGRLDAVWWDLRDDPGIRGMDVYYAYSEDDGVTWSKNYRITDQTIDRRFGVWGNNFDQNSPPSLASVNEYAIIAWDDTRHSRGESGQLVPNDPVFEQGVGIGGGVQDIYVSSVQFKALGGGASKVTKAILAGVVGLLAVGLILTLVAYSQKRKAGGPAAPKKATQTAGVK
ncbi:MAG TPA: hypothetical protein VF045_00650 [Acidimicrobiales bacterium]